MPASEPTAQIAMPTFARIMPGRSHVIADHSNRAIFRNHDIHHDDFILGHELYTNFAPDRSCNPAVVPAHMTIRATIGPLFPQWQCDERYHPHPERASMSVP